MASMLMLSLEHYISRSWMLFFINFNNQMLKRGKQFAWVPKSLPRDAMSSFESHNIWVIRQFYIKMLDGF